MASIITGNLIGLAWLLSIAVGANAVMTMQWQPILAHLIGGTLGTYWGFKKQEKNKMEAHQLRVVEEKEELDKKIKAFQNFIETNDIYKGLVEVEKKDLNEQLYNMRQYSNNLQLRINRF